MGQALSDMRRYTALIYTLIFHEREMEIAQRRLLIGIGRTTIG